MDYWLSLCIPTNGILEWVSPVLDSVYQQGISEELFQIVITDNGTNEEFAHYIERMQRIHSNILYKRTKAEGFLNQIEAFKIADGKLIKFLNHRMTMLNGSLVYLINYARQNDENSVVYFSNGALKGKKIIRSNSFDGFVRSLSYWSSWSAGVAFWKKDVNRIKRIPSFNRLFPHTDILFLNRDTRLYVVDNTKLLEELPIDNTKKGKYSLFSAFAVEYPKIIKRLMNDGDISNETYMYLMKKIEGFVAELYANYVVLKYPCSYDLSNYEESINIHFKTYRIKIISLRYTLKRIMIDSIRRILRK